MENALPDQDKTGSALNAQRFQMLEDIARELSGDVVFPTYFDAAIRLRKIMQEPNQSLDNIANALGLEPLIATKLLHLANSALYSAGSGEIRSLKAAISRLGLDIVRTTSLAIAMSQLLRSKDMATFSELTRTLWEHSMRTASAAHVIARQLTRIKPDEAMLAGLVHDLGAFYMLYRATQYPELRARPDTVRYLIIQWHESIGHTLLLALGLPEDLAEAVRDHDQPRQSPPAAPRTLSDVVYVANLIAGGTHEWLHQDAERGSAERQTLDPAYLALLGEIEEHTQEMLATFA